MTNVRLSPLLAFIIPSVVMVLLLAVGAWPTLELKPRDLPVALVGPADATAGLTDQLSAQGISAEVVTDRSEAEAMIRDREVYGAFIIAPAARTTLIASAASPLVAQTLTQLGASLTSADGSGSVAGSPVVDLVPLPDDDPRGTGFGAAMQPILLGGLLSGALVWLSRSTRWRSLVHLGVATLVVAVMTTIALQLWLGIFNGNAFLTIAAAWLVGASIGAVVLGLATRIGILGIGLTALLTVFFGIPLSGLSSAPELLPSWAWLAGLLLPPASAGSLLRGVVFFDGAGILQATIILVAYLAIGIGLVVWPRDSNQTSAGEVAQAMTP